ncbi:hypothetical protein [Rhodoferax antarcticus]|uniref:Uncharacterized protein n=1 Tax=Rhodoferax antarcticus ANT.BR TaxID=1111071 RepID=A0A1Q8Y9B3_9BURK|nr:hypothetical protein [Rhodoferax antarcticus]OLP04632.1 hypothetical protein BLL52_4206 [Rhodoferax antarcticus ANT.BR]
MEQNTPNPSAAAQHSSPIENTQPAVDIVSPVAPTPLSTMQDDSGQYVTLTSLLIVVAITIVVTLAAVYGGASKGFFNFSGNDSAQKVVILNPDRLVQAGLKAHEAKGTGADAQADAAQFQIDLKGEIDRLSNEGYMVINSRAVVASGKHMDVTDVVLARLGLSQAGASK